MLKSFKASRSIRTHQAISHQVLVVRDVAVVSTKSRRTVIFQSNSTCFNLNVEILADTVVFIRRDLTFLFSCHLSKSWVCQGGSQEMRY